MPLGAQQAQVSFQTSFTYSNCSIFDLGSDLSGMSIFSFSAEFCFFFFFFTFCIFKNYNVMYEIMIMHIFQYVVLFHLPYLKLQKCALVICVGPVAAHQKILHLPDQTIFCFANKKLVWLYLTVG